MNNTNTSVKYSCRKTIILVFAAAALFLTLSGCFSPWAGDGTLTINLDGGDSSRAVISPDEIANFDYEIILEGPGGKITKSVKGGGSITVELAAGTWDLMLRAIGDRPVVDPVDDYQPSQCFPPRMLRALGFNNAVDIKAGQNNNVILQMISATEVSNADQFKMANMGLYDKPEIWIIKESFEFDDLFKLMGQDLTLITDNSGKEVTLTCTNTLSIGNEAIFELSVSGKPSTLTLGRPGMKGWLVIDGGGKEGNVKSGSLFRVNDSGCKLEMFDGVKLCNNINNGSGGFGGGVYVAQGEFIMHGGEISENKAVSGGAYGGMGGGVYVLNDAVFTMNGGLISGNEAVASGGIGGLGGNGGGICIDAFSLVGTFIMNGGEISGNLANASGGTGSDVGNGGGVYIEPGGTSPPYPYFEKTGGVIYGGNAGAKSNTANGSVSYHGDAVSCVDGGAGYRNDDVWDNIYYKDGIYSDGWDGP